MKEKICPIVLAGALALWTALVAAPLQAHGPHSAPGHIPWAELPREGRAVHTLILQGGPFAYTKDASVFGNRERLLPQKAHGYYREYTVPTPGLKHRGARRIVCGGRTPHQPDTCYYSNDHYQSFRTIVPER